MDGANSGIIAIDRGAVMADENTGKMALSGPGTLTAGTVCAGWDAGDFPLAHAILNRLIICRAMIIASRGLSGQIETYDEDGRRENPALANLRRRTLGLYRSYGTETFGDFYDSRYLFPQHRLAVEADGYALRADLQARVLRDADGREVTLGHTPREIGPFEAAIGTWGSPQFYHRESGQLVRVGFTKDQYRGRVLVMEHRQ